MKSIKVLLMAVPMALTLFACSQEEGIKEEKTAKREVNLTLGFTLSSDINSRATRPLTSIDPWQRVTDMRVYVFRSETGEEGTFKLYYPEIEDYSNTLQKQESIYIPEFEKIELEEADGIWKEAEDEEHTYNISPVFPDGFYRLLAVGYDDPDKSPVKLHWTENKTNWDEALLVNESDTPVASEIFTGFPRDAEGKVVTLEVSQDNLEFNVEIECRRTVAGVLLYLKNIPAKYKAQDSWSGVGGGTGIITSNLNKDQEYSIHEVALVTIGHNSVCNAVTRHWVDEFKYDESRFKLTRLAWIELDPEKADEKGYHRDYFPAVGNFVMPSETYKVKETPLVADYYGGMLEPYTHEFDRSLYLCFFTKTGTGLYYPLKLWPVKLVRSNIQNEVLEDQCAGELNLQPDNPYNYNLVANHLYCLGMFKYGDDPDNPEIDQPVDLEKEIGEHGKDDLTIVVVGSWQYEINIEM